MGITDGLDIRKSAGTAGYDHVGCGDDRGNSTAGGGEALSIAQVAKCEFDAISREFSR
jgi:hypothetical protein